jgi:hypothetical protein
MQWRNPAYNAAGTINVEINHPVYGWVPFTASPDDIEPLGPAVFDAAKGMAAPYVAPPAPPAPPPSLNAAQWGFFLDLTGFRDALDAALAAMPKDTLESRSKWAAMRNIAYGSEAYRLDVTLALVAKVRGTVPVDLPSDEDITEAFMAAAQFKGAASLLGD